MYDKLIYGSNSIERIVSVEVQDTSAELFIEQPDGTIESKIIEYYPWLLSNTPHDKTWFKLDGDLHYKWAKQCSSFEEFQSLTKQLYHKDIYAVWNKKEQLMIQTGITYFKGMNFNEPSILSFDIETTTLSPDQKGAQVLIIANTFRKLGKIERKLFCYNEYNSQAEMIDAWCTWARDKNPSIFLGYNINSFDLPYLQFIASRNNTSLALGRDGSNLWFNSKESKFRKDGSQFYTYKKVNIYGREVIDGFFLALKYDVGRKYDNYKLKEIVKAENLAFPDRVYYDADKIRFNYKNNVEFEKIKSYSRYDGDEALQLYDLMAPSFFYSTQSIPKSYQQVIESASGSQLNSIMVRNYVQEEHSIPKANPRTEFEGALSFGNNGVYHNCMKVDVASLYPSIMLTYNIFPKLKDPKNYLRYCLDYFTTERLKNKKIAKEQDSKYHDDLQSSMKIFINSLYGFMAADGLNFNFPLGASEVTRYGREILQKAIKWAEEKELVIVNGDTDSVMYCKKDNSEFTKQEQQDLLSELNSLYPEKIKFEHDGYFKGVLIVKAKNYVLQKHDGTLKIKGSALKSPQKEKALQELINNIIKVLLE